MPTTRGLRVILVSNIMNQAHYRVKIFHHFGGIKLEIKVEICCRLVFAAQTASHSITERTGFSKIGTYVGNLFHVKLMLNLLKSWSCYNHTSYSDVDAGASPPLFILTPVLSTVVRINILKRAG